MWWPRNPQPPITRTFPRFFFEGAAIVIEDFEQIWEVGMVVRIGMGSFFEGEGEGGSKSGGRYYIPASNNIDIYSRLNMKMKMKIPCGHDTILPNNDLICSTYLPNYST